MKKNLKAIFANDPEMLRILESQDQTDLIKELVKDKVVSDAKTKMVKIEYLKGEDGEKGDPGEKGEQGEKGEKGDAFVGSEGKAGKDGKDGRNGTDGKNGRDGKDGKDGTPGKDASAENPLQLVEKLNGLKNVLEVKVLKDFPTLESLVAAIKKGKLIEKGDIKGMRLDDQKWHGGGLSNITGLIEAGSNVTITGLGTVSSPYVISSSGGGGGGGFSLLTITGTIDDSNVTFTATSEPALLVINGAVYKPTGGAITWSYSGGTITLSSPVGTGGAIYGLTTSGSGGGQVNSIVAGTGITVDATDPANPIVSATGGGGGITRTVTSVSGTTSAGATASTDYTYLCTGTFTVTLPTAVGNTNLYSIKNVSTGVITVATTSAQTIDGVTTQTILQTNQTLTMQSNNANWFII